MRKRRERGWGERERDRRGREERRERGREKEGREGGRERGRERRKRERGRDMHASLVLTKTTMTIVSRYSIVAYQF